MRPQHSCDVPGRHTEVIGASVSEPPLSAANGDFVGACVRTSVRMHGPIYRKYFKYLFQQYSLTLAPQCSAFTSNSNDDVTNTIIVVQSYA